MPGGGGMHSGGLPPGMGGGLPPGMGGGLPPGMGGGLPPGMGGGLPPGMGGPPPQGMPPGMGGQPVGSPQDQLPFQQLTGKEPINMGADGMAMSIDEMTMHKRQQQQQQVMMQQQAFARRRYEEQLRHQAAGQALEKRMTTIAKDELKQQALGFVAIGVVAVLGLAFLSGRSLQ